MNGPDVVHGLRRRFDDLRAARRLAHAVARDLTPPAPGAFARFGARSVLAPPARVTLPGAIEIGDDVCILEHGWLSVVRAVDGVEPRLVIGDRCRIGPFCHVACVGEVVFEPDVCAAERVFVADTYHGYDDPDRPVLDQPMAAPQPVRVGRGAFLGVAAAVLRGVTIGERAYVAPGAVVTEDVPARTLVAGNPARVVRRYDDGAGAWLPLEGG